jgi:rhamnopyranosyl-N-acetylglucosaminyl-diphospho-decaprenol beta-1,3/1,4-galactofuranosyltransferase
MSAPLPTLFPSGAVVSPGVCAIVVAYNRAALLRECLAALRGQSRPPDAILVVDNASTDGTREMLRAEFPGATVLALTTNSGGAGGFHAGMKWAYREGFGWLWLMDDDARPAPDCLARLLAHARPDRVLVPLQQDRSGRFYAIAEWRGWEIDVTAEIMAKQQPVSGPFVFRFVGPLIARGVVGAVGLPNKDFFIWFDDLAYALRIQRRTTAEVIVVPDALVFHEFGTDPKEIRFLGRTSLRRDYAAWKLYYGARNYLYVLLWERRDARELVLYFRQQIRHLIGDVIYEHDRWERARMRLLGMRDGAIGRLGRRV